MSKPQLSLSNSPELNIPLRFFATAPWFGLLAAGILLWQGEAAWSSRWSPAILGLTHFMVLGYVSMVMQGALLQVVSVVLGAQPPHIKRLGPWVHGMLTLGSLLLGTAFITQTPILFALAALLLGLSYLLFFGLMLGSVRAQSSRSDAGLGVSIALVSLGITVVLGIGLALGHAGAPLSLGRDLTGLHLSWGLMGWVLSLVAAIAHVVVPMFQLTPAYPRLVTRGLPWALLGGLLLVSAGWLGALTGLATLGMLLIGAAALAFATTTLWLQGRRKKKSPDVTVDSWRLAMLALLIGVGIGIAGQLNPAWGMAAHYSLLLGVILILGFAVSIINGMLYKILPFLIWLHLSAQVTRFKLSRRLIPNIKTMLNTRVAYAQLGLHILALLLFLAALLWDTVLLTPAAIALAASTLLLLFNLFGLIRLYQTTAAAIRAAAQESGEG